MRLCGINMWFDVAGDVCVDRSEELVCLHVWQEVVSSAIRAGKSVSWPVFLFPEFFAALHLENADLLCWIWLAFHHCGMCLRPAVGRTYSLHLFSNSLPLPFFHSLSGFPSLAFSFITFLAVALKWLGCDRSGIWIFPPLAWNAEGTRCKGDTIFPFGPASVWSGCDPSRVALILGLLTQMPVYSCGSVSTVACEPPKAFGKKTHLHFKSGF